MMDPRGGGSHVRGSMTEGGDLRDHRMGYMQKMGGGGRMMDDCIGGHNLGQSDGQRNMIAGSGGQGDNSGQPGGMGNWNMGPAGGSGGDGAAGRSQQQGMGGPSGQQQAHETKPGKEVPAVESNVGPSSAREVLTEKMDGAHERSTTLHLQGAAAGAIRTGILPHNLQHKHHHARVCLHFTQRGWCKFGENCRFSHSDEHSPNEQVNLPAPTRAEDALRKLFDKATKTKDFDFSTLQLAQRFAQGVEAYVEDDLPWRLTKRDEYGVKRLIEAVQVGGVDAAMSIVRAITHPKWQDQKFRMALTVCVRELFNTSGIFELLFHAVDDNNLHLADDLKALSQFGLMIAFDVPQVLCKHDDLLRRFAQALLVSSSNRLDALAALHGAQRLQQLVAGQDSVAELMAAHAVETRVAGRNRGPGGRHSNDHINFREISIVPTMDELLTGEMPFLPRAPGQDDGRDRGFLDGDPETQLLDRHFRLLREDLISTVREAHAKETGFSIMLNVKVIG